jgi:ubiquinone/menaquinone biosynthesis C-methylase UbiE
MPKEEEWTQFFDPIKALSLLGLNHNVVNVADFGCGYGTFTIPAARIIAGKIYAFDIQPKMIESVERKAKALSLGNVEAILRDFLSEGSGLKDGSVDYVFLFNILHLEKPESLLKESYRILKMDGRIGIIHWNYSLELFIGIMTPQHPEVPQWISVPDLNNASGGLSLLGLFLKKGST